jgi:hypothetical protein
MVFPENPFVDEKWQNPALFRMEIQIALFIHITPHKPEQCEVPRRAC